MKGAAGRAGSLEWAFRVEKAQLELPPPKDVIEEGLSGSARNTFPDAAWCGLGLQGEAGQHKMGKLHHADAGGDRRTVAGMPTASAASHGDPRAELAARAAPDWMPGVCCRARAG